MKPVFIIEIKVINHKTSDFISTITARCETEVLFRLLDCMSIVKLSAFTRAIMHSKQYGDVLVRVTS